MSTLTKIELFSPNTFCFSLLVAETWIKTYSTLALKQVGKSFKVVLVFKDDKGIHWLKSVKEQKSWEKYLIKKLKTDKNFFLSGLQSYIELMNEFNEFVQANKTDQKLTNQQAWQKISRILLYVQRLFPFYIVTYYICNYPSLSKYFKPILKTATQARLLTEGYYDKVDQCVSRLLLPRIAKKYWTYYKALRPREVRNLMYNKKVSLEDLKIRQMENYVLNVNKFTAGKLDFSDYLKRHNYYYPLLDQEFKNEVRGQGIIKGKVRGLARVILNKQNLSSIKKGEILITPMTSPDFVPYLRKVGAVVIDHGGILCHAAIACRELKKICVIGTGNATDVFKTGELVEVDANKGIVRKI